MVNTLDKLKFAIVGCGRIALRHAENIQKFGKLVAACDTNSVKADEFADKFSCNPYYNIDDLLANEKSCDVISVCTPNAFHAEHSIKSLKAGINVLCEKPMAITVKDCEEMITEAERSNKRLFVIKQNRFNPPVSALKKVIDEGRLGKILSFQLNCFWNRNAKYYQSSDWKGSKELDGGTLYTQFSHFIDLLYWLLGDVKSYYPLMNNYIHKDLIEFEDTGVAALEFENGAIGTLNYTVNSYSKNLEGSITIFGEKGTVKVGGQYLNVLEYQDIENYEIKDIPDSNPANDYGFYQGSMSNHDKVYENVIDVLMNGASIMTNSLEGLKTVQIIEKIYKQARFIESNNG